MAGTEFADIGEVRIAYEQLGDPADPAVVLVMGFACQLTAWPEEFCALLVERGFRVVRFDNRDIGLSSKMSGRVQGSLYARMARYWLGKPSPVPYTLDDMAGDVVGLMDHLDIDSAHVVGASMGGMISQIMAARHADRVRSLGIMFSSTNQAFLPPPSPAALAALISSPGRNPSRDDVIAANIKSTRALASPKFPQSEDVVAARVADAYDRSYYPAGVIRQLAGAMGTGSLLRHTRTITAATTVLHGAADRLIRPACGRAVARAVQDAQLHVIDGWAHDLPPQLHHDIADLLVGNFARA